MRITSAEASEMKQSSRRLSTPSARRMKRRNHNEIVVSSLMMRWKRATRMSPMVLHVCLTHYRCEAMMMMALKDSKMTMTIMKLIRSTILLKTVHCREE